MYNRVVVVRRLSAECVDVSSTSSTAAAAAAGALGSRSGSAGQRSSCKVCGDDAAGMYFGALVCVPCKVTRPAQYSRANRFLAKLICSVSVRVSLCVLFGCLYDE